MKRRGYDLGDAFDASEAPFELWVTLDYPDGSIELEWVRTETGVPEAAMRVRLTHTDELAWEWVPARENAWRCRAHAQQFSWESLGPRIEELYRHA